MPSNLTADSVQETSVDLSWSEGADDDGAEKVRVRREQLVDGSYWPAITSVTVDPGDLQATDDGVQPDREYRYRVQSVDSDGTVLDESSAITVETPGSGVPSTQAPATGWRVEITPPNGPTRTLSIDSPTLNPTVNGTPSMEISAPRDETWTQDRYDDADAAVWRDGIKQPIDSLDSRAVSPGSSSLSVSGGSQLGQRVVARSDAVEPVADFVERLIDNETAYKPVVDSADQQVRRDVLLQEGDTLSELQAAFKSIPSDLPLKWNSNGHLEALPTPTEAVTGGVSDTRYTEGSALNFTAVGQSYFFDGTAPYDIPNATVSLRAEELQDKFVLVHIEVEGEYRGEISYSGESLGWKHEGIGSLNAGQTVELTIPFLNIETDEGQVALDTVSITDNRYNYTFDNTVNEENGHLDGPELIPDAARLELDAIQTPLAVTEATLSATTVSGQPLAELALRDDGTGSYVTEADTTSTTVDYDTLAAEAQGRVGVGRRDVSPRDTTPRLGYESERLDSVEMRADLDETPVLINRTFDDTLIDILREAMEIYDGAFELREGSPPELHVSRIDGRPADVDPAISDVSFDRDTSGAVDVAIVYAAAEAIRQLPFDATQDQWEQLPLGEGRIVEQSETIRDGPNGSPLDRGDDYEIREVVESGAPEIKLLTSVSDPHIDCQIKPRGKRVAADAGQYPDEIVRDAPELNSKQMADLAAFQAVEGSYTDATIDATVELPPGEIGFEILDALNVADLPGDDPYQVRDVEITPQRIRVRLGAGQTAEEAIQEIRDKTSRVSERV